MGAIRVSPATETKWTVMNGPMQGTVRLMNLPQFVIGRSQECDLVLVNDPKVSRRHASVTQMGPVCEIQSLNEDNPVLLNGQEIQSARLTDGDILTLGKTELKFNATTLPMAASPNVHPQAFAPFGSLPGSMPSPDLKKARPSKAKVSKRLYLYGALALIGVWLFTDGPKKKPLQIKTEKELQADIDVAQKLKEAADKNSLTNIDNSLTGRQAQENYVRGFRDYKKGQFERALVSFQACLALNPEHILCNRYLRLAQRRFGEIIQYQLILGRKYRDQNQFKSCRAAFRNVMIMVKDSNNPLYKEAKTNFEACNTLVEGTF